MRILWLSPWFRPRARIHAENLQSLGAEVMLVTSDLHPESDQARRYETVLLGRPIPTAGWLPFLDAYRDAKRFQPDVVVTELLRDPRWRMLAKLAPRVRLVPDDQPHDEKHVLPWWNRFFFERWDAEAYATVVFSNYVAESLRARGTAGARLYVAPLTSDLDPSRVPDFVPAERRRNFMLIGRQWPYKNHDVVFAAWEAHTRGNAWRGDELVVLGRGEISRPLPPHARWNCGRFKYRQVVDELVRSKGSIVHSRSASQSGVQVLSMQLGVPTLVSTAGALPEYQPAGSSVTGIDDIEGLSRAMDALADAKEAEIQGKAALEHFRKHYDSVVAARRLLEIFHDVIDQPKGT
jgi:glycosyltransferase involved in cell wall biosynthesis